MTGTFEDLRPDTAKTASLIERLAHFRQNLAREAFVSVAFFEISVAMEVLAYSSTLYAFESTDLVDTPPDSPKQRPYFPPAYPCMFPPDD
jgi:hypothetical protein